MSLDDLDDEGKRTRARRTQEALSPLGLATAMKILGESATKEQMRELQKARTPWEVQMLTILNSFGKRSGLESTRLLSRNTESTDARASMIESRLVQALPQGQRSSEGSSERSRGATKQDNGFTASQRAAGVFAILAITAGVLANSSRGGRGGGGGFVINFSQRFVKPQFQRKLTPVEQLREERHGGAGFPPFNATWPGGLP